MNGTKLNNEKHTNSLSEDDYIVMTSYLASTDTYEKMSKTIPPVIEEKHKTSVSQDQVGRNVDSFVICCICNCLLQPDIPEKPEEAKREVERETKENENEAKEIEKVKEANENDEDKRMSKAISSWMDSTQIPRVPKENLK